MSTVRELEIQLAQAKEIETKQKNDAFLQSFQDALSGRYFLMGWTHRACKCVGVITYNAFKIKNRPREEGTLEVEFTSKSVTLGVPMRKSENDYEPMTGINRRTNLYESATSTYDVTRNHVREISKAEFLAAWNLTLDLARIHFDKLATPALKDFADEVPVTDITATIDVPHVVITAPESSMLHGSPFLLPNFVHLASPEAKRFVSLRLAESTRSEARVAHLAEACDMHYLQSQARTRASLARKFGV